MSLLDIVNNHLATPSRLSTISFDFTLIFWGSSFTFTSTTLDSIHLCSVSL